MVKFFLKGDAKIIMRNGDPSSHEPDQFLDGAWQRSASMVNAKSSFFWKTKGEFQLEVKSNGLASDVISFIKK